MTALNGWIALALYLIGLGLAFGFRAVVHLRRNGDTGFRLKAGAAGSAQWWGKLLFAVALLLGLAGPVTQIVGIGRLTIPGGTIVEGIGLVLALLGTRTLLRAQREMGASWRVGVDPEEHTSMVTDGTFAVVRNPVATQFLNLRQFPSYSAPVLGIFYNGTQCTVLSESGGWYNVRMDNGLVGYFRGEFLSFDLTPVPPPAPPSQGTARIVSSGGRVNLRQGPSYAYPVIASYYPGKTVYVYSKSGTFWQVSVDAIIGYIDRSFLKPADGGSGGSGNATIKGSGKLNLRAEPNTSARVISQYEPGTSVKVTAQGLEWCAVTIPSTGAKGYFMTKYLRLTGLPEIPTKIVKNNGSYVNLRGAAGQSASITTKVPHNSVVTILIPGASWTRVKFGAVSGFMMTAFLK